MKTILTINELVTQFVQDQDVRDNTRENYRFTLLKFVDWMVREARPIAEPRRVDVIAYKKYLEMSGKSVRSINSYLTSVRMFFKYLEQHAIYEDIAVGIRSPKQHNKNLKGYLDSSEVRELLNAINRTTIVGKRNYAIVSLMVHTGMRRIEVARLNVDDIYAEDGKHYIKLLRKGQSDKKDLELPGVVVHAINDYLSNFEGVTLPALFVTHRNCKALSDVRISRIVMNELSKHSFKRKHICTHSLRHSAAINAILAGVPIRVVSKMLGHSTTATTEIYLRAIEEEKDRNNSAVHVLQREYAER